MVTPAVIGPIAATSPTLADTMRACFLRAGLSRLTAVSQYVLGTPKAWMGSAYHFVLENIPDGTVSNELLQDAVGRLWQTAIARQYERSSAHPLDRRFGQPERWPGYYLAKASALVRARELVQNPTRYASAEGSAGLAESRPGKIRERRLVAAGGKLIGKPDLIRADEVVDYKSGAITDYDDETQAETLKPAYTRQLRIYGFLINEVLRWWPSRGRVLPFVGPSVVVELEPSSCTGEALEAVRLLDEYNDLVRRVETASALATPSPSVCKWCEFKILCPPFWESASPLWHSLLEGAAVEATVLEQPRPIHDATAFMLRVAIDAGTETPTTANVGPLGSRIHDGVSRLVAGDRIRIIGAWMRSDSELTATSRTVLMRIDEIPEIVLHRSDSMQHQNETSRG